MDDLTTVHYNPIISIENAVITCDSATYNGQTQVATNIVVTLNGETLISGTDYTVSNNDGGINAGNYTFAIDGIGNYGGSKNGTFTINKVTPTVVAPTAKVLIYNGSAQELVNAGSTDYGTLQYSLDDSNYSTTIPSGTNAVSYTIYYKVVGDSNVNDVAAASINNSISKVTPTVVSPTAKVLTYNSSAQELVNAGSTDFGTLQYRAGSDSWSTTIPTRTRGGSYTVEYRVVGNSNVNDVAAQSVICSINEKPVTATVTLSQTAYTYNGSACQPTPTVSDGGTIIDPSEYSVTYSNNINAGTGTVTISDNVGGDYNVIGSTTFTINKVTPTVTAPTAKSLTYTGSAQALANAGSTNYGTLKYSLDDSTYSTGIPSGTNATSYTVYYKVDGDSNINSVAAQSISVTIAKADQAAPTATGATTTYNTTATATASGGGGQGSLEWESAQSQTSVGSHSTRARWSGNSNYNASPWSNSVTVQMNKANQSAPTATGATVYEGSTATATASGGGGQGSLEWSNGSTRTTLGSQTTKARWSGNGNYNASSWSNEVILEVKEETRVVAKFNITSTSSPTEIGYSEYISGFSAIEIDGVVQQTVVSAYTFSTTGEHTVKYTLTDPTSIGDYALSLCNGLTSVTIPNSVTSIGESSFSDCSGLASITIPNSVTSIGEYAFSGCSGLTSVTIPNSVTSIGNYAFSSCSGLTSVTIPNSVTSIGNGTFSGCTSLTNCTIGNSVASIDVFAFQRCSSLTAITIPNSVMSISFYAFDGCSNLTSITCNATTAPTIQTNTFRNVKTNGTLRVPRGSTGYDVWMGTGNYYLGKYNWTKVEQ